MIQTVRLADAVSNGQPRINAKTRKLDEHDDTMSAMNSLVCSAIRNRRVISFYYDGGRRTVEPYCYGSSTTGHDVLRGYQTAGYSSSGVPQGWKMFRLDELNGLAMTDEVFDSNRAEYGRSREEVITTIYCQI